MVETARHPGRGPTGVNFIEFYESGVYDGDVENPGFQCALEAAAVHWKTGPVCPTVVPKPPSRAGTAV